MTTTTTRNSWFELLPSSYHNNPDVLVILAPAGCKVLTLEGNNGLTLMALETPAGMRFGLHAIDPAYGTLAQQESILARHNLAVMPPAYVGPLSDIPHDILTKDALLPLVFTLDEMWKPMLQLRGYVRSITKKGSNAVN